jgi:ornithine carbamoyltransferase
MSRELNGRHFIATQEWNRRELDAAFETALDLKRRFALGEPHRLLADKTLFMIFFEQSTRTRNSMEAGMTQLGGHAHDLTPDKMQLSHGESAKDTAVILSRMGHGIACRNCFYGTGNAYLRELALHSRAPVMSLQDDVFHPFQGLADLMTLFEHFGRDLRGLKVTISWAYAKSHAKPLSVPQEQILLFPRYGIDVTVANPREFPLSAPIVETARANAAASGARLRFVEDMDEAVRDAQVVIPKNWGGFGAWEKHHDWIFDRRRAGLAARGFKLMHALPADRGREVTDDVIDDESISIVYDEAENRLHTAKAIMALTMAGR